MGGGEVVQELRVPPVEGPADPVQQDQRDAAPGADAGTRVTAQVVYAHAAWTAR